MTLVSGFVRVNRPYFFTDADGDRVEFPAFGYGIGDLVGNELREFQMYVTARQIQQLEISEPENISIPTITGTAQVGEILTADPGTWSGWPIPDLTYQWMSDGSPINGATAPTYEIVVGDIGSEITVIVTATNIEGDDSAESDPTATVIAAVSPTNDTAPVVTGDAEIGAILAADDGEWTAGPAPVFTYAWETSPDGDAGWTGIPDADTNEYTVAVGDEGDYLRCVVTATNVAGTDDATSNVIGPIIDPEA